MSKFDDVFGKPKPQERPSIDFPATLSCQYCQKYCYNGKYYPMDQLLVWECSEGHKSYIEGFQYA